MVVVYINTIKTTLNFNFDNIKLLNSINSQEKWKQ